MNPETKAKKQTVFEVDADSNNTEKKRLKE